MAAQIYKHSSYFIIIKIFQGHILLKRIHEAMRKPLLNYHVHLHFNKLASPFIFLSAHKTSHVNTIFLSFGIIVALLAMLCTPAG